jgi:uncharacterized protein (TIGR02996 family)
LHFLTSNAMTNDGDALFRVVCEQPWEDTPRLMLADWLEENDEPLRAEFIRVQIEAAKETSESRRRALVARASALHQESRGRWTHGSPTGPGVRIGRELRRGFYYAVSFGDEDAYRTHAQEVFNWTPIDTLSISMAMSSLTEFLKSKYVARLVKLSLGYSVPPFRGIGDAGCEIISACPRLAHLVELVIPGAGITDTGALLLANSPHLKSVTTLRLISITVARGRAQLTDATVGLLEKQFGTFSH